MMSAQEDYLETTRSTSSTVRAPAVVSAGTNSSKRTDPDGYKLAAYNVPHFIAQSIAFPDKVKYNIDNLEPIANWGADPAVLIVPKDSEFNSVNDLVNWAKKEPRQADHQRWPANSSGHHIAFLQLAKATGAEMTYVPHPKAAPEP